MTPIDLATADTVRIAIRSAGLTQSAVAEQVGIPPTTWLRRMNGAAGFRVHELAAIAKVLKVSPGDLLDDAFVAAAKRIAEIGAKEPSELKQAS